MTRLRSSAVATTALVLLLGLAPAQDPTYRIQFEDTSASAGVSFRHHTGGSGAYHLPETMGAGLAWFDYDVDGDADLYLVDSGALPGSEELAAGEAGRRPGENRLYANRDCKMVEVAGVAADRGYGKGASSADYDNDGFPDLFIGNWGPDVLYRNNGDGTFTEVSVTAGVADPRLSVSSSWADFDADGWLDLFVVTYVSYDLASAPVCGEAGLGDYCHPAVFEGQRDIVYRNAAGLRFEDRSDALRGTEPVDGKGLALITGDLNDDRLPDIYIANDTTPNFTYINQGDFVFEEQGVVSGLGVGHDGQAQAGMGIALGDVDGDAVADIAVTNFEFEPYNLYRRIGRDFYMDDTFELGLGGDTLPLLGFGIVMSDYDLDGDLDLSVANGHILVRVDNPAQPNQVFESQLTEKRAQALGSGALAPPDAPEAEAPAASSWRASGTLFLDRTNDAGEAMSRRRVSRAMAQADFDGDGRPDLAVTNVDDVVELLRNTSTAGGALVLRLRGRAGNRDAIGAEVWATPCTSRDNCSAVDGLLGFAQRRLVQSASSYAAQSSTDVIVGLGAAAGAQVRVRWSQGDWEALGYLDAGQVAVVVEGRGVRATRTLRAR